MDDAGSRDARHEFGERVEGRAYRARPSVYAVVTGPHDRVAVMRSPIGVVLPGGGIDPGETPEEALHREVREECGAACGIIARLGEATEFMTTAKGDAVRKDCVYFRVELIGAATGGIEPDHELVWMDRAAASTALRFRSDAWAITLAVHGAGL